MMAASGPRPAPGPLKDISAAWLLGSADCFLMGLFQLDSVLGWADGVQGVSDGDGTSSTSAVGSGAGVAVSVTGAGSGAGSAGAGAGGGVVVGGAGGAGSCTGGTDLVGAGPGCGGSSCLGGGVFFSLATQSSGQASSALAGPAATAPADRTRKAAASPDTAARRIADGVLMGTFSTSCGPPPHQTWVSSSVLHPMAAVQIARRHSLHRHTS